MIIMIGIGNNLLLTSKLVRHSDKDNTFIISKLDNIKNVLNICKKLSINHILPIHIEDIFFVLKYQDVFRMHGISYYVSDVNTINKVNDKKLFDDYMRSNEIFSKYIPNIYRLPYDFTKIKYPCIVKSKIGINGEDSYIINNPSEFQFKNGINNYIVQECIPGSEEYITHILASNGVTVKYLSKKYSFDQDIFIKSANCCFTKIEDVQICDDHIDLFKQIVFDLKFSGLLCIGYKIVSNSNSNSNNETVKIFEINPRIGSSLVGDDKACKEFLNEYINLVLNSCNLSNSI